MSNKRKRHGFSRFVFMLISSVIFAACFIMIVFTMFMHFVGISDKNGMEPTLRQHDVVVVNKFDKTPDIGDIIIYEREINSGVYFSSRVIATGDQTINIDYETNSITIDGKEIKDTYKSDAMQKCGNIVLPYKIPENEYFIIGDNRNDSVDSRFSEIGTISDEQIIGVVLMRIYPYGDMEILDESLKNFKLF